jgi:hypothetical protein
MALIKVIVFYFIYIMFNENDSSVKEKLITGYFRADSKNITFPWCFEVDWSYLLCMVWKMNLLCIIPGIMESCFY